jgi:hypothetical protein
MSFQNALDFAKRIAYSHLDTLINTYTLASDVIEEVNGCLVETGVAAGGQIIMMKQALIDSRNSYKKIIACDSFEGIPLPTKNDDQMAGIRYLTKEEQDALPSHNEYDKFLISSGATVHSLDNFSSNIISSGVGMEQIIPIKGWFEKTMPLIIEAIGIHGISLLRMDGDNYSSTKVVLESLYPLVNKGGYIIIDDWALAGCRKACEEYFEKKHIEPDLQSVPNATVKYFKKTKE